MLKLSFEQFCEIIALGGGVKIDASAFSYEQLCEFAAFASSGGGLLFLNNLAGNFGAKHLEEIAALGGGKVIFES